MAKPLRYADAVKLLGGTDPAVGNALGGLLSIATAGGSDLALSWFDAKNEMVRVGQLVTTRLDDAVRGYGRYDRNQRLQAAHAILVVTSFFEAFDQVVRVAGTPAPELTRDDQVILVAGGLPGDDWIRGLLAADIPAPSADRSYDRLLDDLTSWFAGFGTGFGRHLRGLAEWDAADERTRRVVLTLLGTRLPELAVARYEQAHRRLAGDIGEFAIWLQRTEAQSVSRGLAGLEDTLLRVTSGRDPQRHRAALAAVYRADLDRPILGGDAGDLTVPRLDQAYVDPLFQVRPSGPHARPADDDWWDGPPRGDFATFLATYLTTPQAESAPMLLLGQPGGGKSALTRILAARLPAADFLAVRVVLREVPADADIHDQIEHALRSAIGETVAWADLARSADGAMPVVLLDGFDELLQATGIHHSDYLRRVAAFQHREAVQGRPVAVIVTSRTTVADRAQLPPDSLVVRLEAFSEVQIERWLTTWNTVNARSLTAPLPLAAVLRFADLARQPLLLLMLALHDAGDNALQHGSGLDTAGLFERLLRGFAEREVRRWHDSAPPAQVAALVEAELMRLSVVAFAMFNRSRQWVTDTELNADLAALGISSPRTTETFRAPLTAGEEVVGRFFFIQRAQAVQSGQTLQTYEFLHATFGEYLVARLTVHALRDTAARAAAGTLPLMSAAQDDGLIRSLLSFVPLVSRATVLPFVATMLDEESRPVVQGWLSSALRTAMNRPEYVERPYRPFDQRADHGMAIYSLNLTLLAVASGAEVKASELFPGDADPAIRLRDGATQWIAATTGLIWGGALDVLTVRRSWTDGRRDITLTSGVSDEPEQVDPLWTWELATPGDAATLQGYTSMQHISTSLHLAGGTGTDMLRHALEPLTSRMPKAITTFVVHAPARVESVAHSLLTLWSASAAHAPATLLSEAYDRAITAVIKSGFVDFEQGARLILRLLRDDGRRLDALNVANWLTTIAVEMDSRSLLIPDVLECIVRNPGVPWSTINAVVGKALGVSSREPLESLRTLAAISDLLPRLVDEYVAWATDSLLPAVERGLGESEYQLVLADDPVLAVAVSGAVEELRRARRGSLVPEPREGQDGAHDDVAADRG